jgi:protein phosphatase
MPWSAKAEALLRDQYAAVGSAATTGLAASVAAVEEASTRVDVGGLLDKVRLRREMVSGYVAAYRNYCWEVRLASDLKLAPFHLLATEGAVHTDKSHQWHLEVLGRLSEASAGSIVKTPAKTVDLADEASASAASTWWEELTGSGGEGMVVKPIDFITRARGGAVQPGIKCRGREYLRIIYGPEYTAEENLQRLRQRFLGMKRSLAKREFALGVEALDRFVKKEPLYRVHECVFGVLAMESEPVDPAL